MSKKNEVEAEAEVDENAFVNVDPTELMNHHRMVNQNIDAERFEAEKAEALEKFGLTPEGKSNGNTQRAKPLSKQDWKYKGSPNPAREKADAGTGAETKGSDGEAGASGTGDADSQTGDALTDSAAPAGDAAPAAGDAKPWES